MDSNYELVAYDPSLKPQLTALQYHLWSPSRELNTAYFDWKYERNPYVAEPLIYVALCEGQAVGMRGFFGTRWTAGSPAQELVALYADDFVIAPEHRNRGLASRIMATAFSDLAARGYHYLVNLSPGPVTYLSSLAMGWRSVGLMRPMRRRRWRARIARRLPWISRRTSGRVPFADVDATWNRLRRRNPKLSVDTSPCCEPMAQLVARSGETRLRHVRDAQYFQWRFEQPLSRYRFLYWTDRQLEGYLVLQEYVSGYAVKHVINIVDWEASTDAVRGELLHLAVALVRRRNLVVWSAGLSDTARAALAHSGFRADRQPDSSAHQRDVLLIRPTGQSRADDSWQFAGRRLLDLENWDVRMLYSMHG
jgi:GNAT superfamily N-acetyltransferase